MLRRVLMSWATEARWEIAKQQFRLEIPIFGNMESQLIPTHIYSKNGRLIIEGVNLPENKNITLQYNNGEVSPFSISRCESLGEGR